MRVLFICYANVARGQVAEAYFKTLIGERGALDESLSEPTADDCVSFKPSRPTKSVWARFRALIMASRTGAASRVSG